MASVGALLMGVGATVTWITVGIPNETAHTAIRGTDLTDGVVVLLCAVVTLAAVFATRIVGSAGARQAASALAAIAGLVAGGLSGRARGPARCRRGPHDRALGSDRGPPIALT